MNFRLTLSLFLTGVLATAIFFIPAAGQNPPAAPKDDGKQASIWYIKKAPPLARPQEKIVPVKNAEELMSAMFSAASGTTIALAPGVYTLTDTPHMPGPAKNVAIRGVTGDPKDVVIQGPSMTDQNSAVKHGLLIGNVEDILIADLTIKTVYNHSISLQPQCQKVKIYNCRLIDAGQQFIKGNTSNGQGSSNGVVEYTVMEYTKTCRSHYTSGIDIHAGSGWQIRHNAFVNIRSPDEGRVADPSVLMWGKCKDTIVESNIFLNCHRGISLGLNKDLADDHTGGIIRNNFFFRDPSSKGDVGISVANSANTKVLHNTIILNGTFEAAIEARFAGTKNCIIAYNLTDAPIISRDGAELKTEGNMEKILPAWFTNFKTGDLHITQAAGAIYKKAPPIPDVTTDYDGQPRNKSGPRDIGADEFGTVKEPASAPATKPAK